jgi:hypothetical protein
MSVLKLQDSHVTLCESFSAETLCIEVLGLIPKIFGYVVIKTQMSWSLCFNIPKKYIRWPLPCTEWCCHVFSFNLADALKKRVVWFMVLITVSVLFCFKLAVTLYPAVCRLPEDAQRTAPHAYSYNCPIIILRCCRCCSISRYSRLRGHLEGSVQTVVDSVW